jgi:hypothetical protein
VHRLDLRSSGDTAGPRDEVVGYGAWALGLERLDTAAGAELVSLARRSLVDAVREGRELRIDLAELAPALRAWGASFVTLRRGGELRGCIGSLEAERPLALDVARSAHRAATADPRFPAVHPDELDSLSLHVSVLGPLERLHVATREELLAALRPGSDGLVLQQGGRRATFLDSVWEQLRTAEEFVRELERKAGLAADAWRQAVECWRYSAEHWEG